jgi:uncharacterized tellurite resistance protein B-like protein
MQNSITRGWSKAVLAGMIGLAGTLAPSVIQAQDFEGVIQERTISIEDMALDDLINQLMEEMYADEEMDEEEEWTEEAEMEEMRKVVGQIFSIPMDRLMAMAQSGDAELMDMTLYIKASKMRADMKQEGSPFSYMISDVNSGVVIMVNEPGRYYVKWDAGEMQEQLKSLGIDQMAQDDMEPAERPQLREVGETMDISGMRCTAYEVMHDDVFARAWVTAEHKALQKTITALTESFATMLGEEEDSDFDAFELFWEKGMPVRTQRISGMMTGFTSYEVQDIISVESKSLSSDMFEIPAGYTEKSLQDLWGGR